MELRELFGRNLNITRDARKIYDDLEQGFIFQNMKAKHIFMLCMSLAFVKRLKRKEIKRYPLLNTDSFSDADLWLITSIAVAETGDMLILKDMNEVKKIAEEYSIAGLSELQLLIEEYRTSENFMLLLEQKMNEASKLAGEMIREKKTGLEALREDETVEFKSSIEWDYKQNKPNKDLIVSIAKTIAGFMNADGGRLIIGIDDDKNILGLEKDISLLKKQNEDGFQLKIGEIVSNYIGKEHAQLISTSFEDYDGKKVASVQVKKASEPVYVENKDTTHFFIRTGNSTQQLNTKEATAYIKKHWK